MYQYDPCWSLSKFAKSGLYALSLVSTETRRGCCEDGRKDGVECGVGFMQLLSTESPIGVMMSLSVAEWLSPVALLLADTQLDNGSSSWSLVSSAPAD